MFRCTVLFVALVAASLGAAAADEAFLSAFSRHQSLLASGVDDVCDNVSGMSTGCESTLTSIYTNTQCMSRSTNRDAHLVDIAWRGARGDISFYAGTPQM